MYLSFGYSCSSFLHNWPTIFISIIHTACKNLYLGQPYHENLVVSRFVSKLSKHSYLRKPQQVIRNGNYILRFSEKTQKQFLKICLTTVTALVPLLQRLQGQKRQYLFCYLCIGEEIFCGGWGWWRKTGKAVVAWFWFSPLPCFFLVQ